MSEYRQSRFSIILTSTTVFILVLVSIKQDARLQKLEQKGTFTVVCGKYKYRETTHDYVGYDCKLLGGENK